MLANLPKDNLLASVDSCALYYFPEIPCSLEKSREAESTQGHFVNGAHNRKVDPSPTRSDSEHSEKLNGLIEKAFNKGLDQGRAETIAAQRKNVEQATGALKAAADEMALIRQRDVERMETETVRLALAIAKKIIGNETEHGQLIVHVVKAALKKVVDPRHLTLRLNPKDIDTVNGFKQEWLVTDDFAAVMRLETDATIQRGGCIIETKLGDVDARIDQQIRIIEELLTDQLPKPILES